MIGYGSFPNHTARGFCHCTSAATSILGEHLFVIAPDTSQEASRTSLGARLAKTGLWHRHARKGTAYPE